MNDISKVIRMYIHYSKNWEQSDDPEDAENRMYHYQQLIMEVQPTYEQILSSCLGDESKAYMIADMIDTLNDYARKP